MKKLIFSAAVLASAFFAASCQQELLDPQAEGATVTYTVEVPDAIATKAIGDEITDVDKVYFEVYRAADVVDLTKDPVYSGVNPVINRLASFSLEFVKNQEFVVLFWAQNSSLVKTADNPGGMYDINDLRAIKLVNPGASNNAAAQVFAGKDTVSDCVSAAKGKVTLKRPVSQINVYTTTESLSFGNVTIGLDKSSMTVAGLYNTFNVATGAPVELDENVAIFEYTEAAVPNESADNAAYTYVAMNYVGFASQAGTTTTVDFTIKTTTEAEPIEHTVSNVPVKPNYRTNIIGNLITSDVKYNVELDQDWGPAGDVDDDYVVEVVSVASAEDLQEAIENIQNGAEGNIKLEGDIDLGALFAASTQAVAKTETARLPIVISEEKTMTLDLNGFTISTPWEIETDGKHYYAFDNKGTLKIVDSKAKGKIVARGIFNYGHMTLESGTIEACDGNGGYGVRNYEGAEFVMNGGTVATLYEDGDIPGEGYDACPIRVDEGAKAEINGGIINNVSNFTVAIDNYGETIVNDGTFTTVHTTLANSAVMTINGGSFTCNGLEGVTAHALWAAAGTTTINGGTFNGKDNYNGFNVDASKGATVYIKGGEFLPVHSGSLYGDGSIIVTGGTFFDKVSEKYLAAGYSCQQNEEGKWIVPQVALAKIGDDSYPTLAAAIEDVEDGVPTTITVQAAVFTDESIVIPAGKSITLDLNGMSITGKMHKSVGAVVKNEGTLTIKNGTISSTAANGGSAVANNGTLAVEKATLNGAGHADGQWPSYTVNNTGVMTATETKITSYHGALASYGEDAKATLNKSEIDMAGIPGFTSHGIYTYNGGKVVVNGGTYANNATDQASSGASVINGAVEVNAGTFTGRIENYYGTPVLKGGTYSVKPNENFLADGYKAVQNADGKWEVVENYVAQVGDTKYESLQEAFNVGGDITLLSNVMLAEKAVVAVGKTVVLDLNGFAVTVPETTGDHIYAIENQGTLTIKDSRENGSISSRGIHNYGTLTLESGKLSAIDGNGGYAVNNKSGSTFVMNGGWIAADNEDGDAPVAGNYDATALNVLSDATATINGGKITNAGNFTYAVSSTGTLIIPETSTIEISGRHGAIYAGGETTINAGTYQITQNNEYTDNVIYVYGGEMVINGGTFIGDKDVAQGGTCVCDKVGGVTINGGIFGSSSGGDVWGTTGTVIKGGKFENLTETQHIAEGYELNANGEVVKVQ